MKDKDLSFLPEDYVERRIEMRTNLICLSLFGVVLAGVLGAYFVTSRQRAEVLNQQQSINTAYAEAAKRIGQVDELQGQKKRLLRKAQVTTTLIEPVPRSNLLAELINRKPPSLTFVELELASKQIEAGLAFAPPAGSAMAAARNAANGASADDPAPNVPRYQVDLKLIGLAPTAIPVAQYMASLARCPLLETVDLVYSEERRVEDVSMRRFRIDMMLDPASDVRSIDPVIVERRTTRGLFGTAAVDRHPDDQE
jgi:Tfp pilus assembly protein PilN